MWYIFLSIALYLCANYFYILFLNYLFNLMMEKELKKFQRKDYDFYGKSK